MDTLLRHCPSIHNSQGLDSQKHYASWFCCNQPRYTQKRADAFFPIHYRLILKRFNLQRVEEALRYSIVPAVSLTAHALHQLVLCNQVTVIVLAILATAIRFTTDEKRRWSAASQTQNNIMAIAMTVPWSRKSTDAVFTGCGSAKYQENGLTAFLSPFYDLKSALFAFIEYILRHNQSETTSCQI